MTEYYEHKKSEFKRRASTYYLVNKEAIKTRISKRQKELRDQISQYHKDWRDGNPAQALYRKELYKKSAKKIIIRNKERRHTDINFRLRINIRSRLRRAIKTTRPSSTIESLGCSIEHLKTYLESKFSPGMTWDNYGKWHIDHRRPLKSFDLSDRTQYADATHFTNLQPLWALDNIRKNAIW